ncbi:Neurotrypsin [Geodia barretti]|uniref:Neurotrypsin n=1 Tax=Geodia barretti TaxID=519541 RepID=A0AA35QRT5_GEOBA|nr:Neurotrypsin [Geodia barretti]
MLGFSDAIRAYSSAYFGPAPGDILLDNMRCAGTEHELIECSHNGVFNHDCSHEEDAGVSCTNYTTSEHPVRLVGGNGPNEGRVEIYNLGQWGTVCDDGWTVTVANVVCVQLGYAGANRATVRAEFGRGTGTIWLDNVACTGLETALDLCASNGWGNHDCSHYEDAGAECEGEVLPIRLRVAPLIWRGEWRSITTGRGAQCVTTTGTSVMQQSSAVSWDMMWPSVPRVLPLLDKDKVRSGWMMWPVLARRALSLSAPTWVMVSTTVATTKTLVSDAQMMCAVRPQRPTEIWRKQ